MLFRRPYLRAKITLQGREYLKELMTNQGDQKEMPERKIKLFISHGSKDSLFVQALIDLIRAALNIGATQIRCISIDGYRLPGGANTNEQLKKEVHHADAFIGVISPSSIRSIYVIFELGARWGANLPLIPLIAPGTGTEILAGPLTGINALSCNRSQLHQLLYDLSEILICELEPSASYERHIDNILNIQVPKSSIENNPSQKTSNLIQPENEEDSVILVPCNIIYFVFIKNMIYWRQSKKGGRHVTKISSNAYQGRAQRA